MPGQRRASSQIAVSSSASGRCSRYSGLFGPAWGRVFPKKGHLAEGRRACEADHGVLGICRNGGMATF